MAKQSTGGVSPPTEPDHRRPPPPWTVAHNPYVIHIKSMRDQVDAAPPRADSMCYGDTRERGKRGQRRALPRNEGVGARREAGTRLDIRWLIAKVPRMCTRAQILVQIAIHVTVCRTFPLTMRWRPSPIFIVPRHPGHKN